MERGFTSLKLHNVSVFRQGKMLLGLLDLDLTSSGITAILGHNGAGKSLFIKVCHGQFPVSSGSIQWNGQAVDQTKASRSLMFQTPPLLRRSVAANVEFPLIAQGIATPERRARVYEALNAARLTDHATAPAASLSGGEKQRMALARALVTRPQVILLDEPSASLDPASTKELEASIKEISATGVKVLLTTHDLMQARRLADDVLVFGAGDLLVHEDAEVFFNKTHEGAVADFLEGRL